MHSDGPSIWVANNKDGPHLHRSLSDHPWRGIARLLNIHINICRLCENLFTNCISLVDYPTELLKSYFFTLSLDKIRIRQKISSSLFIDLSRTLFLKKFMYSIAHFIKSRSSAFVYWISVRFHETDCIYNVIQPLFRFITVFTVLYYLRLLKFLGWVCDHVHQKSAVQPAKNHKQYKRFEVYCFYIYIYILQFLFVTIPLFFVLSIYLSIYISFYLSI